MIDEEAAAVVRRIYQLCIDGFGVEKTAAILERGKILKPTEYWKSKGVRKPEKKSTVKNSPYCWCKATVEKILLAREYVGNTVNFKTYSKSFKNNRRYENPEENHAIFENTHEAIIDARRGKWCSVSGQAQNGDSRRIPKSTCSPDFSLGRAVHDDYQTLR